MTDELLSRIKPGNILTMLGAMKNSLTSVSQRIADYVLTYPEKVTQLSISQLAIEAHSGEASIIRFCRSLGYKGFQDFKLDLAIECATSDIEETSILEGEISANDDIYSIGLKLQSTINTVLSETLHLLDPKQIKFAVEAIQDADFIFIFGVGSSGITAEDMKNKLMRIGFRVDAVNNNHLMYMQAALLKQNDVAIGISHSGNSAETVHALKVAKQAGAKTIALTHHIGSSLMDYADHYLINGNREGKLQGDSISTKAAQLFVLDLLYTLLVQANPERVKELKLRTLDALKMDDD